MNNEIRVWDPLVRVFHWSLVLSFTIAYLTGEEYSGLHIDAGYVVLGLILFRLVWGFIGTRYARFSDFVYSPKAVLGYLKSLTTNTPRHYTGHNPAGGWMVIAMFLCLAIVSVSGLKVYAIEEGLGPLAGSTHESPIIITPAYADDDEHEENESHEDREDESRVSGHENESEEFWEEIHEASSNFMLLLIFLHVAGVMLSGRRHKENLVKAMITGNKPG
jgi:cytochrome b